MSDVMDIDDDVLDVIKDEPAAYVGGTTGVIDPDVKEADEDGD